MGDTKKQFDEQLQETRSKQHDKLRYLRRKQNDEEAQKRLEEYLKNTFKPGDDMDFEA